METEPWRQYGGIYRMVDFDRNWAYTPSVRTLESLPSLPPSDAPGYPDGDYFVSGLDLFQEGVANDELDDLGLEIGIEPLGEPALPDSAVTSVAEPRTPSPPVAVRRKRVGLVKKWFSSVRANLRRRKRVTVNCCEEHVVPPPPLPPSPSVLPTTPSLSPLERTIDEEPERGHQTIDWQAPLALWEWKAWGYYARPWINGVWVNNYPSRQDIPENVDIREVVASLVEDGKKCPERWVAGLQHSSLPPRPIRWWGDPRPVPSLAVSAQSILEAQGCRRPSSLLGLGKSPGCSGPWAQPHCNTAASTRSAIADDVELPWPILIRNKYGVTIQDVLQWIHLNFQEYISDDEWNQWPMYLRNMANISYGKRQGIDGVKRIDYLGFHSMFRGLEVSDDGNSWYLFVGRPW
ncbi:hypothetical protein F5887DRAFT_1071371 [Amanita rubescens]|nr:hypothetical protein F5887DRAFT_1071371 [Amanita rubescens]